MKTSYRAIPGTKNYGYKVKFSAEKSHFTANSNGVKPFTTNKKITLMTDMSKEKILEINEDQESPDNDKDEVEEKGKV
jgi:hypothetical protein